MTQLETLTGGITVTCSDISPEDIANVVTNYVLDYDLIAHGFPVTSPFGLRAITKLKRGPQEDLLSKKPEEIQKYIDDQLRDHGSDVDAALHTTWRHAYRLKRFADNKELTPLQRDFVTSDSTRVKWSLVEPAFRASAGILLSRFATIPSQGAIQPIALPEYNGPGSSSTVEQQYGHIAVTNLVRYGSDPQLPLVSSYLFETIQG